MSGYTWDFSAVWQNLPMLLQGLLGSLQITALALLLGLLIGLLVVPFRMNAAPYLRVPAGIYMRGVQGSPDGDEGVLQLEDV